MSAPARRWQPHELAFLREETAGRPLAWICDWLGRSRGSVKTKLRALRVSPSGRRPYTATEERVLRDRYGREPAAAIARDLGRPVGSVYRKAGILGLRAPGRVGPHGARTARLRRELPGLSAAGLTDVQIAARVGLCRNVVSAERRRLGQPKSRCTPERRAALRAGMEAACRAKGVATLADLRYAAHREYARSLGWPEDLRPVSASVLTALWELGPMTRREICDAVGLPWKGTRKSLASNDPEGSTLAHLAARGLVVRVPAAGPKATPGKGRPSDLYLPALDLERGPVSPDPPCLRTRPR